MSSTVYYSYYKLIICNMSKNTIYSKACKQVPGFEKMGETFMRKLVIQGKAKSTHENYLRQISKLSLHFKQTPLELQLSELEEYLYMMMQSNTAHSLSSFKHLVYGLRKLYHLFDKEELELSLPSLNCPKKVPVVLSHQEMKRLLNAPEHILERVLFGFVYDTGIRIDELTSLLIPDVDLDRAQVHIRNSKNKKGRYITMSPHAVRGIRKHLSLHSPSTYLFESPKRKNMPICKSRIRRKLHEAVDKANIKKQVCVHTLRHTYATHQLEAGQNIMNVKEAMGHSDIRATLIYLHIAQLGTTKRFGSMDTLYPAIHEA